MIIHYCWFGRKKKPKIVKECISSWKKEGHYFIKEWNENNISIKKMPLFVRQAYKKKLYAFVSDYVRFYILYSYGGIYLDTDMELISPLPNFKDFKYDFVACYEDESFIGTGFLYANKGCTFIGKILDVYNTLSIFDSNIYDITSPKILTKVFLLSNNKTMKYKIYKPSIFYPNNPYSTHPQEKAIDTIGIHHYLSSWKKKHISYYLLDFCFKVLHKAKVFLKRIRK